MAEQITLLEKTIKEIEHYKKVFSAEELSFLVFSGYYISSQKGVVDKLNAALNILSASKNFKDSIMEVYFYINKELRLVALYGLSIKQKSEYIGISISPQSHVGNVLGKQGYAEDIAPERDNLVIRSKLINLCRIKTSLYFPIGNYAVFAISRKDFPFSDREKLFINTFIKTRLEPDLALAIENESNIDRAIRDSMTTLFNQTYFKMRLKEETVAFERKIIKTLSLIMIDIDYFKHFNDTNGHPAGDVVIKKISEILKKNTRTNDIVARYGGEEFAVLMPNASTVDALKKAEIIRSAVEQIKFEYTEKQPEGKVTISLGVANMPQHCSTAEELLTKADEALYFSKRNGKNKVSEYAEKSLLNPE